MSGRIAKRAMDVVGIIALTAISSVGVAQRCVHDSSKDTSRGSGGLHPTDQAIASREVAETNGAKTAGEVENSSAPPHGGQDSSSSNEDSRGRFGWFPDAGLNDLLPSEIEAIRVRVYEERFGK